MMAWTVEADDGVVMTSVFQVDAWNNLCCVAELIEEEGEWTIEMADESFSLLQPKGDSHRYLTALFGMNAPPSVDKDEPFMNYRSGLMSFDVWEVR